MIIDDATISAKIAEIDKAIRDLEINANRELAFLNGRRIELIELIQQGKDNEQEKRAEAQAGTA